MRKSFKIIISIVLLFMSLGLFAQDTWETNCGRFGIQIGIGTSPGRYNWPMDFEYNNNLSHNWMYLICEEWTDHEGTYYEYVRHAENTVLSTTPLYNKKYVKYPYPEIIVNETDISTPPEYEAVVSDLISDQMIETEMRTWLGVNVKQRVYSWSHPDYQDFAIAHIQLINTGNNDSDDEIELDGQNIHNFYFCEIQGFNVGTESRDPLCENHKKNDRSTYYGNINITKWAGDSPDGTPDFTQPQVLYAFSGDDADISWEGAAVDAEGDPKPETGEFMTPQYVGDGLIHLDHSTADRTNDFEKIQLVLWDKMYTWVHPDHSGLNRDDWFDMMRYGRDLGNETLRFWPDMNPDVEGYNYQSPNPGDYEGGTLRTLKTLGPWDIAFGDTINIVFFRGAAGQDPFACREAGEKWLNWYNSEDVAANQMMDDDQKRAFLREGEEMLFDRYEKAVEVWENGLELPNGLNPLPPAKLEVTSGPGIVHLVWDAVDEADFYRVYSAAGDRNAYYELLADSVMDPYYTHEDPQIGFVYYYNVRAVKDGVESSQYMARTNRLGTTAQSATATSMNEVRVVPNPFVLDPEGVENYGSGDEKHMIMFAGLPGPCEINVFTVSGDHVDQIVTDRGGGHKWQTTTKYRQYLASGIYVYHVKSLEGKGEKMGKFIVIR